MVYNAGERKDVRKAEKAARIAARDDRDAIVRIMSDTFGRAWIWRKLEAARIFADPFTGDALVEAFNKGYRSFGMNLLSDIMLHCPQMYLKMTEEANVRRINDNDSAARSDSSGAATEYPGGSDANGGVEGSDSTISFDDNDDSTTHYNH
jgi:hypothetical protein